MEDTFDPSRILFEDNHLFIINKRCGELVQSDRTGDISLLELCRLYIKKKYNKPGNVFLGLPHRLDRPASGIVVYTKTGKALSRMTEMFRTREIQKKYLAVCCSVPPDENARLVHFLKKNEKQNKSYIVPETQNGARKAELLYHLAGRSDRYSLIEVELISGRHHQIRCQLASIDCPIRGDLKYGAPRSNKDGGIDLHAWKLSFIHPVSGQPVQITAQPPAGPLWELFPPDTDHNGSA
ncbi:MAG: RNA pseudouridine synthase [Spirochaetales bacterium]|nr:RNA pseudouridine synthase [Spirochaetales bacterium]